MTVEVRNRIARRPLGKSGLTVSEIAFGTVELGLDYGIPAPGEYGRPSSRDAIRLLEEAVESGINLFDTAPVPAYGGTESLLGEVLGGRPDCLFATKVTIPRGATGRLLHGFQFRETVRRSLEHSLKFLRRDVLDIVQIYNPTVECISQGEILEALLEAKQEGKINLVGASVYTEAEALAMIHGGGCDVLQIPYNVLDQRMAGQVFPAAEKAGVGIMIRSAFLKGVLTAKGQWLPAELTPLREAAARVKEGWGGSWESLPEFALRFCLSAPQAATVLVGLRTSRELNQALSSAGLGKLPLHLLDLAQTLSLRDERLLNPSHWPAL
ncbi:MAG: aldo/keto reductase [Nitrospirota bacterium]|nr:aldo/keto reductase [Nitrospirota bacterium]